MVVNTTKPRVAYLGHGLYYGGATTSLYLLIKSVDSRQFEKHLCVISCRSKTMQQDFLKHLDGFDIVPLGIIHNNQACRTPLHRFALERLRPIDHFIDLLQEKRIDILHINTTVFPHLHRRIKERTGIKIVTHVRELIPRYGRGVVQRYMIRQIHDYSDAIIAISDNEAGPFRGHPNLHVLANPFDFSRLDYLESTLRREHGIPDDVVLVGMMGQFHRHKGHFDFLRALNLLLEHGGANHPFMFVIIGIYPPTPLWKRIAKKILLREDYGPKVMKFIHKNGLESHLKLLPYAYEVFGTLKAMDIIVRPSLTGDPWGRDIIESMALGKPIVATGTSDFFVQPGQTGYLIPPEDPEALAEGIRELINDQSRREAFGEHGYHRVRSICDFEAYGPKIMDIYQGLLV